MSSLPATLLKSIDADKATLDAARPLSRQAVLLLRERLVREWAGQASASAIEDNNPTLHETRAVLECIPVDGTPLREHLDATHHRDAIRYLEDIVSKREGLSERQIRNLHRLVLNRVGDGEVRRYRHENVAIAGASTMPPGFLDLPADMAALIDWYRAAGAMHPIARAAELHARLLKIHPFVDGNGRTARLLLDLELMKDGYPPAIIRDEDRPAYHDALDHACAGGEFGNITRVVAEAVQRALHLYLDVLGLRYAAQPGADHYPNRSNGEPTCPLPPPLR
ncbi:Fic family protein [Burkholderia ubonensis]|uniref:Cell filamentation protein Fic n=1 Tax=Burkholderia ubonensis subsp. mesacidophila TaxID=265293 RepID=A0A2A4FHX6_9BURK|nr:Fic family protein [Burkholderia ubonensis]PCE32667.1 cell filamentation protein Fic [Burkholderia ubonensis subsp. mesacidophila]